MQNSNHLCPICEEGKLELKVGKNRVEYKGQTTDLDLHFSICDTCGSEQADPNQTRYNKRLMMAFKKQVEGLLLGDEMRLLRERLGLTQKEAAQLFGGGPVAFSKYENDDVMQSEAMDKLLRLAAEFPSVLNKLRRWANVRSMAQCERLN